MTFPQAKPTVATAMPRLILAMATVALLAACGGGDATGPDSGAGDGTGPAGQPSSGGGLLVALTDAQVFMKAQSNVGTWVWYKNSPDTLSPGSDSPHFQQLRTRYNTFAATQLDADGRVVVPAMFPDSSVISKEVYVNGRLAILSVMLKRAGDPNAGHGDWLWGEYRADGTVLHSVATDNGLCHNCHIRGVDHTRMNDAHP